MTAIGKTHWAMAGCWLEVTSNGDEPGFTSREELSVLNTGDEDTRIALTLLYEDRPPVGPYEVKVRSRRLCKFRLNDLIFPEAPPLGVSCACIVEAAQPVVVQVTRVDTSRRDRAWLGTIAYSQSASR